MRRRRMVGLAGALLATAQLAGCQAQPPSPAPSVPTDEELRSHRAWWAVESATRDCMSEAGVEGYALAPPWAAGEGPHTVEEWLAGRAPVSRAHDAEVLLGPRDGDGRADTRGLGGGGELWRATGCLGRALHEAGTD